MPTNRRRRLAPRRGEAHSPRTIIRLKSGNDWPFEDGAALDEDELRDAWEDLRDDILAERIAAEPFSRPWAWWRWDAPEPRQHSGPPPKEAGPCTFYGMPCWYGGVDVTVTRWEEERDYLIRHPDLLTDHERALLEK